MFGSNGRQPLSIAATPRVNSLNKVLFCSEDEILCFYLSRNLLCRKVNMCGAVTQSRRVHHLSGVFKDARSGFCPVTVQAINTADTNTYSWTVLWGSHKLCPEQACLSSSLMEACFKKTPHQTNKLPAPTHRCTFNISSIVC